jgi:DUF4097 and DUF4098 domain-containing protein YvlB
MSERKERFEITGPLRLVVRVPAGEVRVVAGSPGEVIVSVRASEQDLERISIEQAAGTVTVEPDRGRWGLWAPLNLQVAVGAPPEVRARLASANLVAETPLGSLEVAGGAGSIRVGAVEGALTARLASGDVVAASVAGRCSVVTASGDVRVERAGGDAEVRAVSGDVTLGAVTGDASLRTASGDIAVGRFEGSRLDAKTVSGDVRVGVPGGRRYGIALQSLSGDIRTDFPVSTEEGSSTARLTVGSVSGDIRITPAVG